MSIAGDSSHDERAADSSEGSVDSDLRSLARTPDLPLNPARFDPGTALGPYVVQGLLGAGGMAEVYRALDTRLGREVAIKCLPIESQRDPASLRRFEHEARAVGALNHPNILAVYDVGAHEGTPYAVTELLEGQTLREAMRQGPLPVRTTLEYAAQIARGLSVAHDKGIVHRDLKPENLFVTREGFIKILDFGLAKLIRPAGEPAATAQTETGAVVGTAGYMSPEQARGLVVDARSDLFSFGVILYELVTGRRAFQGPSRVETLHAVLTLDPLDPARSGVALAPPFERLLRRCLEKDPQRRYQSVRDLAFHLEDLAKLPSLAFPARGPAVPHSVRRVLVALAFAGLAAAIFFAGRGLRGTAATRPSPSMAPSPPTWPQFQQVTFRRGTVTSARFAPDEKSILYTARWDDEPSELFATVGASQGSRPQGLRAAALRAVSRGGELAVTTTSKIVGADGAQASVLAVVPMSGGAPREIARDVQGADFTPDGQALALLRADGKKSQLELPPGRLLYAHDGRIDSPRVSPTGEHIAFFEWPRGWGEGRKVSVVTRDGQRTVLSEGWRATRGLAWSPSGREVWFVAAKAGQEAALHGVGLDGQLRTVLSAPGPIRLEDVSRDGRVLITHGARGLHAVCMAPGETRERDLSWIDHTWIDDLSADGRTIVLSQAWDEVGVPSGYVRKTDGSPAIRLDKGLLHSISPDGRWVAAFHAWKNTRIALVPTGPGEPLVLDAGPLRYFNHPFWFPDGERLLFNAEGAHEGERIYVQAARGGPPKRMLPDGFVLPYGHPISPDGTRIAALDDKGLLWVFDARTQRGRRVPTVPAGLQVIQWTADGRGVYLYRYAALPANITIANVDTGAQRAWKTLAPVDPVAVLMRQVLIATDGRSYAYNYERPLTTLYVVDGLR